ncbi:30S ribosomal protein S4 [Candidatus Pacearchaeota archaeon]|nr:30S ribosomal protein S4 [Candidatus Pacearchaeota archaeon]
MIRKHKRFVRPKKAYEKTRMEDENKLMEQYGLKNKREIWKMLAQVTYFRRRAKALAKASGEEQELFFKKLQEKGLEVNSIADVLALTIHSLLNRRLQTLLMRKSLTTTMRQARQMIVHKKVTIQGNVMNVPSYIVSVVEEATISVKSAKPRTAQETEAASPVSEKVEEVAGGTA